MTAPVPALQCDFCLFYLKVFVFVWLCSSALPVPSHICILYWLHFLCFELIGKWNCFSDCFNSLRPTQLAQRFLTLGRDPCLNDVVNLNDYFKPMSAINVIYICNVSAWLPNYVCITWWCHWQVSSAEKTWKPTPMLHCIIRKLWLHLKFRAVELRQFSSFSSIPVRYVHCHPLACHGPADMDFLSS